MKILHVITMLDVGGAEKLLVDLLPLLRDKGNQVDLLLFNGVDTPFKQVLRQKGIRIFELSHGKDVTKYFKEVYDPLHILRFKKYLNGYDIIHTHNSVCQYYVVISKLLFRSKVKLVTTEHSPNNRRRSILLFRPIDKWMYAQYSKVICIADKTRLNLDAYIGRKVNTCIIHNGVDIRRYVKPIKNISRQNSFIIIMVAALREEKDHETLIKAMAYLPGNYSLLIVGDGVKMQPLKDFSQRLSLSSKVTFTGSRMDIPDLLDQSDVIVLSSHWEGLSLSSIEGMASGRPFIASDVDGLREMVGGAGLLFPHGDDVALAQMIRKLCENPTMYSDVARACQARAKHYDIRIMADNYNNLYKTIIEK